MSSIGLEVSLKWAKDNWDKHTIYAYSLENRKDWVVTDIAELDSFNSNIIIYIDNE